MSSIASPFASALPAQQQFFQYDSEGDAIMTDAATGLPIVYNRRVRTRSPSLEDELEDDRPSKRSRSSSGDTLVASPFGGLSPIRTPPTEKTGSDNHTPGAPVATAAPSAPKKATAPVPPSDHEDGDGAESALRNLAERMAAVVLEGEPRDTRPEPAPEAIGAGAGLPPPAGEDAAPEEQGWCVSVTCPDLALRLDMRHPRVVLNLLRFVKTYNELAPEGEDIHLPFLPREKANEILNHESVVNPAPEFADEIAELRALVDEFSCTCQGCDPYDSDGYSTDSNYSRGRYGRDW